MLNRINRLLDNIIGVSAGVFIGHGIYVYSHYRQYPDLYRTCSAPWYTSILLYGAILLILVTICFVLKIIIQKKLKK